MNSWNPVNLAENNGQGASGRVWGESAEDGAVGRRSFTDAKAGKQAVEHTLVVDPAGDLPERRQSLAQVARQQFGRAAGGQLGEGVGEAGFGAIEGVGMPGVDGEGVIEALRSHPELSRIPVIRMTGRDGVQPPVLFKPFSLTRLLDVMAPYFPKIRGG